MNKLGQDADAYQELRRRILVRDDWRCQRCGRREGLDVHHIVSRAQGGSDQERNLITLCRSCHADPAFLRELGSE